MFLFETCLFCRGKIIFVIQTYTGKLLLKFLVFYKKVIHFNGTGYQLFVLHSRPPRVVVLVVAISFIPPNFYSKPSHEPINSDHWGLVCRSQNIVSLMFQGFRDHNYDVIGIIMDLSTVLVKRVGFDTFFKQRSE